MIEINVKVNYINLENTNQLNYYKDLISKAVGSDIYHIQLFYFMIYIIMLANDSAIDFTVFLIIANHLRYTLFLSKHQLYFWTLQLQESEDIVYQSKIKSILNIIEVKTIKIINRSIFNPYLLALFVNGKGKVDRLIKIIEHN